MNSTFDGYVGQTQDFDQIKVTIASPQDILSWSHGEVKKPETINYRTFKPEKDGLFDCSIFGPVKDYECLCGKYKRTKYKGIVCDKCGVEVTTSRVRRERMGHITLAAPVVHIWFLRLLPSKIGILLDILLKDLERVLYFESYIITQSTVEKIKPGSLVSEEEIQELIAEHGYGTFTASIGAESVLEMLQSLDLEMLRDTLQAELMSTDSETKKRKIVKRLNLVEDFIQSGNKPEWMVLKHLPIAPPDLRPLIMLDGGRFATSDLNELYRRVINRNNRLKRLLELNAPEIIIRNEKRMLQEAVDALLDNGRRGKVVKSANRRPFKSISDMLKGKHGRFRQNLLGKRVDYSGRSVIIVGPTLKLGQCGLPKLMALELFKPFVYAKLQLYGYSNTIKAAKKMVENQAPKVWDVLAEVIKDHPVLLNRAPTLHRLSIQAFEPVLIDGKAIQLHPMVCAAFNADFDGDQIAVHVPLSIEAQLEARVLMMSTNNLLSPANGRPILVPDKDIVLGLYYLTLQFDNEPGHGMVFGSIHEVMYAIENKVVTIHTKIKYRIVEINIDGKEVSGIIDTTPGRLILWDKLPKDAKLSFSAINKVMNKKNISTLVYDVSRSAGQGSTVKFLDSIMELGFYYATKSGMSFGMDDMVVPASKAQHVNKASKEVSEYEQQYLNGLITSGEKYNKIIDTWSKCTESVSADLLRDISVANRKGALTNQQKLNAIYVCSDSGARGSPAQIRQLAGMRGLMAKPSGEIIPYPIKSNFSEGLNVLEYFISTHGTRKGLADTALKTANSGYLTRRLVDVAQDLTIRDYDCKTSNGMIKRNIIEGGEFVVHLADEIIGRTSAVEIRDPQTNEIIVGESELITEDIVARISTTGIDAVKIRSVLTCGLRSGVCAKCYGRDLSTNKLVSIGEAVGIIAAQSIGEPGTQLTLRTFHIGGAATKGVEVSAVEANFNAKVRFVNYNVAVNSDHKSIVMSRSCEILLFDEKDYERARLKVPYGARILVKDGESVKIGQKIADWDAYGIPILAEKTGRVVFQDIIDGISVQETLDESTGVSNRAITETRRLIGGAELKPRLSLVDDSGKPIILSNGLEARYYLANKSVLSVEEGALVNAGDILARIPKESTKSKDITGGLPRVTELVEARRPKDHAIIADIDGKIEFGKDYKTKRRLFLRAADGSDMVIEYVVPKGKHILVGDGDLVRKGDLIVDGPFVPHDVLRVMGLEAFAHMMIKNIQDVYRLQGVKIDNKHIEVIVKMMLRRAEVTDPGDSKLIVGDQLEVNDIIDINEQLLANNPEARPVKYEVVLQGITKASLQTNSFISAASFQETTRVIAEAAVAGKVDTLRGLKENVIVGRLIPAGTGIAGPLMQ